MARPQPGKYTPYFETYIQLVQENNVVGALKAQDEVIDHFFEQIPNDKHEFAYAVGKWTMKEVLQHLIDAERVFQYRALCLARREKQSLPGSDENDYVNTSNANKRDWKNLCEELKIVRSSTKILFRNLSDDALLTEGLANNHICTANVMGFVSAGHVLHHVNIITERYLK